MGRLIARARPADRAGEPQLLSLLRRIHVRTDFAKLPWYFESDLQAARRRKQALQAEKAWGLFDFSAEEGSDVDGQRPGSALTKANSAVDEDDNDDGGDANPHANSTAVEKNLTAAVAASESASLFNEQVFRFIFIFYY